MEKDFDRWNHEKKRADANDDYLPLYHEREIRWCRLGVNIGFEQDGTGKDFSRLVLFLKGFSRHVCLVIPLTTSIKKSPYTMLRGAVDEKKAVLIISQIRLIDTRRLDRHIATVEKELFERIRKAAKDLAMTAFHISPLCRGRAEAICTIHSTGVLSNVKTSCEQSLLRV